MTCWRVGLRRSRLLCDGLYARTHYTTMALLNNKPANEFSVITGSASYRQHRVYRPLYCVNNVPIILTVAMALAAPSRNTCTCATTKQTDEKKSTCYLIVDSFCSLPLTVIVKFPSFLKRLKKNI